MKKMSLLKKWSKSLPLVLGGCLCSQLASAQMDVEFVNGYDVLSSLFTSSGKTELYSLDSGEKEMTFTAYDENFQVAHKFSYPATFVGDKVVTQKRALLSVNPVEKLKETVNGISMEEVLLFVRGQRYSYEETEVNGIFTFVPAEGEVRMGETYTKCVYDSHTKILSIYDVKEHPVYSESWETVEESVSQRTDEGGFNYQNYDLKFDNFNNYLFVTQTLFNDDDKYEYVVPEMQWSSEPIVSNNDYVDVDGEEIVIGRTLIYSSKCVAMKVVSEDGTLVHRLPMPTVGSDDGFDVLVMNGKTYLVTSARDGLTAYYSNFYELDKTTTSVKQVSQNSSTRITPRMPRRNEMVTVELDKNVSNVAHEVVVTAMNGKVVGRQSIPAGEHRARLSIGAMSGGVYNFTIFENGKRIDNGKIIIR